MTELLDLIKTADPRLPVGLADEDNSELSQELAAMLAASEVVRIEVDDAAAAELQQAVVDEEIAAAESGVEAAAGVVARQREDVVPAAEVGAAKPHPAIFHAASRGSGVPLEAFLHVGDDPLRDVQAARDLGMATVWVNRDRGPWPDDLARADLEVTEIAGLAERLVG